MHTLIACDIQIGFTKPLGFSDKAFLIIEPIKINRSTISPKILPSQNLKMKINVQIDLQDWGKFFCNSEHFHEIIFNTSTNTFQLYWLVHRCTATTCLCLELRLQNYNLMLLVLMEIVSSNNLKMPTFAVNQIG